MHAHTPHEDTRTEIVQRQGTAEILTEFHDCNPSVPAYDSLAAAVGSSVFELIIKRYNPI